MINTKSLYKNFCDKIVGYDKHVEDAAAQFKDWHKKEYDQLFVKSNQTNNRNTSGKKIFANPEKYTVILSDFKTGMSFSTGQTFIYSIDFLNLTKMSLHDRINMIKMFLTLNKCRAKAIVYEKDKDAYDSSPRYFKICV